MSKQIRNERPYLTLKKEDTRPAIADRLTHPDGEPFAEEDFDDVDRVKFFMAHIEGEQTLVVNSDDVEVDEETGNVEYEFEAGETTREGRHVAEWVVEYTDGTQTTHPNTGVRIIDIQHILDRELDVEDGEAYPDLTAGDITADTITVEELDCTVMLTAADLEVEHLTVTESIDLPDDADVGHDLDPWGIIDAGEHGYPGDGSGGDIMDLVREHPNKVIVLPEGEYHVETELDLEDYEAEGVERLAIVGEPHATLKVTSAAVDRTFRVGLGGDNPSGLPECRLHNLTLDLTDASDIDAGWGRFFVSDLLDNRNLDIEGRRSYNSNGGDKFGYLACITDEDGIGWNYRIRLPDGDEWAGDDSNSHAIGIASDPPHVGTQFWLGCHVSQFWDNGFYLKGAVGPNIVLGCTAENCGRSNVRLGIGDVAMGLTSRWNMDGSEPHYPSGDTTDGYPTLLASDEARGTYVRGAHLINKTSQNDVLRVWLGSEQATFSDIYIENETSQRAIRASANDDHSDTRDDSIGEKTVVTFQGVTIREDSGTSIRGASVHSEREHVVLRDVTYLNANDTTDRAFMQPHSGASIKLYDSNIETPDDHLARVRTSAGKIHVENCTFNGGIDVNGGSLEYVHLIGNDMRAVSDVFSGGDGATTTEDITFIANLGYLDQTDYGALSSHTLRASDVLASSIDTDSLDVTNAITSGSATLDGQLTAGTVDATDVTASAGISGDTLDLSGDTTTEGDIIMPPGEQRIDITAPEAETEWMHIKGWETSAHTLVWGYEGFEGYYWKMDGDDNSFQFRDSNDTIILEVDTTVNEVLVNDEWVVTSGETTYSIEKDGTDGSGIINYKTS